MIRLLLNYFFATYMLLSSGNAIAQYLGLTIEYSPGNVPDIACGETSATGGVYIRNTSTSQPAVATLLVTWHTTPENGDGGAYLPVGGVYDAPYSIEFSPKYVFVLVHPGESRFVGCKKIEWRREQKTDFEYKVVGAYAPTSAHPPAIPTETPERYLKYISTYLDFVSCGNAPGLDLFNLHPERTIYVEFDTPQEREKVMKFSIPPLSRGSPPLGCSGVNASIKKIAFVTEPMNR